MRAKLIRGYADMTEGNVYRVMEDGHQFFRLIDDEGDWRRIPCSYVEVLPDEPSTETAATTNVVDPMHPPAPAEYPTPRLPFVVGDKVRLREVAYGTNVSASPDYGSTDTIRTVFRVDSYGDTHDLHVEGMPCRTSSLWFDLVEPAAATTAKESNPKDIIGSTKASLCCVPCGPLFEVGAAMLDGSAKYGRHNWRVIGVRASVYYEAALRHLMRYWEGEDIDPDSGVHHLAHVSACCLIARDAAMCDKLDDDRPLVVGDPTACVKTLIPAIKANYPDPKKPFTERGEA